MNNRLAAALIYGVLALTVSTGARAQQDNLPRVDAFLRRSQAHRAAAGLTAPEKQALDRVLGTPNRTLDDRLLGDLLRNPVAWRPGPNGRQLLRSVIHALPEVCTVPGAARSLSHACHPNEANFRGFGFEAVATAALHRFREPNGARPRMVRMSADVPGPDGKMLESDGCCVFSGADRRQRLVTMKSVSSVNGLRRATHKAMSQLALRNGHDRNPGQPGQPGIFMLGYSDPAVLERARRNDWRAVARCTGANLLVLAVDQLSGRVTRLASEKPPFDGVRSGEHHRPPRVGQQRWRPPGPSRGRSFGAPRRGFGRR